MVLITPAPAADGGGEEEKKTSSLQTTASSMDLMAHGRLVEYFVVVSSVAKKRSEDDAEQQQNNGNMYGQNGSHQRKSYNNDYDNEEDLSFWDQYDFKPEITARYPLNDHAGNPLHESLTFFCHSSGGIRLRTDPTMPKIHYFAATGGTGQKMYGTCLTLWEPFRPAEVNDEKMATLTPVYLPKCLVLLSTHPYLVAFREFLSQLVRMVKMGDMVLPLERYVVNFCAEIPAPPPGSFQVQTQILDSSIQIWSPPHNQPLAYVSLPYAHLFECLDVENIILVWHCLALERQVLLTSTQLSLLTECAEILLSMLFPMRWSHAYIPLLPHFLIPILSAPMPFFCGLHKANLADALCDLSRECVVVDLDKNLVTLGPDTDELPPLPPALLGVLKDRLDTNAGMIFREARSLTKNDDYSDRGIHLPNHVKLMAEAMWESRLCLFDEAFHLSFTPSSPPNVLNGNDLSGTFAMLEHQNKPMTAAEKQNLRQQSQWDAVQEAFLDSYVFLLRNYRKFLVFPSKTHEGAYGGAGFRSKEFVQAQRYDMQECLQELIGTQMFDDFVTKRLYGSGEADVTFFDRAVDKFLKNQGILSSSAAWWKNSGKGSSNAPGGDTKSNKKVQDEPLLQSARVHSKLKTIVPPEPSGEGLPSHPLDNQNEAGPLVTASVSIDEDDNASVNSTSTSGTRSTSRSSPNRQNKDAFRSSIQDKAAGILEKSNFRYTYETFPSELDTELFGKPRPLPAAVIAEFDRQRQDAARFRRKKPQKVQQKKKKGLARTQDPTEAPPSAEVSSFTLFFTAFSAMVGKELLDISDNPLLSHDRTILATYTHPSDSGYESEADSVPSTEGTSTVNTNDNSDEDDEFQDAQDEETKEGVAEMKASRPEMRGILDDSDEENEKETLSLGSAPERGFPSERAEKANGDHSVASSEGFVDAKEANGHNKKVAEKEDPNQPKSRFRDSLSTLQIEEAKAAGRAQLFLAFEMLTMMKKRGLKADPEAYQCLIDACGRVGDTQRATELLGKMHSDGIVADGVVYSCLVSAFSVESAWKHASGAEKEELPAWANSSSIEMDWNKLQKQSFLDSAKKQISMLTGVSEENDENDDDEGSMGSSSRYQKMKNRWMRKKEVKRPLPSRPVESMQFYVTEPVEMQIELGENLLEIVYPDISVDTDNETCPRCNFLLSDDDVVAGWTPSDSQDYTTCCPNCTQRFVPHFRVQSTSPTFMGSRGPASPLTCERLSPWVLQKEIRSVMADLEGIENLLDPEWREKENKNAVLWWNLILSCMRYRFPFSFLLQGSFEQNLIAPMPEQDT